MNKRHISTLLMLVLFVFMILLASLLLGGLIWVIIPGNIHRVPLSGLFFLITISLIIGTILAAILGDYFLRPLRNLIKATKEVAGGNFNVYVESKGSNELVRLTKSFNEMAKELASIETLRTDFVSNISHEFKTPITSIKGFAKRLLKNHLTEEQKAEYLQIIISESERLSRLSSNILLLSNLESHASDSEREEYLLDEQLRKIILILEPQLQKHMIDTEISLESVRICANEELLHHVWLNLLDNAIKFSNPGGTVSILLKAENNKITVTIADNGVGMDSGVRKRMFEKFYQAEPSRATDGNGLGLALVKKILDIENGTVCADSVPGGGTVFAVEFGS